MSYPEPRYLGDSGEVNSRFRGVAQPPEIVAPNGTSIHYIATHATTSSEFGLYKVEMEAKTPGPKCHFHRTISESFFILAGEMSLYNGDRWTTAGEGDFLHVPVGGLHAFRNDSENVAAMLLLFCPGAPREEFYEKMGTMAQRGGQEFADFLIRHDNIFVDPPQVE